VIINVYIARNKLNMSDYHVAEAALSAHRYVGALLDASLNISVSGVLL
jgi:hypothetical protein